MTGASLYIIWYVAISHTPVNPLFYVWLSLPVVLTLMAFRWPDAIGLSTLLMIVFLFLPFSMSVALFYEPAIGVLLLATLIDLARRVYFWFRQQYSGSGSPGQ